MKRGETVDKIIFKTPIGNMSIEADNGFITNVDLTTSDTKASDNIILLEAKKQMSNYFLKPTTFSLPLKPKGTPFQQKIFDKLLEIPYGKTLSYSDIAAMIESPKSSRAVGQAVNKNPLMIIIPCHRVIGKNGSLVGYNGGLHIKEALLKIEGIL